MTTARDSTDCKLKANLIPLVLSLSGERTVFSRLRERTQNEVVLVVFVYMILLQNLLTVRVKPVRVHPGNFAGWPS